MINKDSLKLFCRDNFTKIENYELAENDKNEVWEIHHRLELTINGEFAHSKKDLIRLGMYYNRPYFELILLKVKDHIRLHKCSPYSEFGKKFFTHYGFTHITNPNLYKKEKMWYIRHNKTCRWEM